jgi:rubredoxin-NAD+ reductase
MSHDRGHAPLIIIGAGMAGYAVAREWRKREPEAPLTIITRDVGDAYAKPMLSNAFALGKAAPQLVQHSAAQMAQQLGATIVPVTEVAAIDSAAHTVLAGGAPLRYRQLVLATGAQPIRLPLAGDAADAVLSVNHLAHYAVLRQRLAEAGPKARVLILGAGLIGCEFADDLAGAGHQVTLVDPNARPLAALAAPGLSAALVAAWQARPISLRLGTHALAVDHRDGALRVTLADASTVDADVVVSAVGLRPDLALAAKALLATGRGILVDAFGRTSAPDVYALGDCAEYAAADGTLVLPYVAPLLTAARAIAATLAGTPTAIVHGREPIIVKTASCRLALSPPAAGSVGQWVEVEEGPARIARFFDAAGALRGFGSAPFTPALRQRLLAEMPA